MKRSTVRRVTSPRKSPVGPDYVWVVDEILAWAKENKIKIRYYDDPSRYDFNNHIWKIHKDYVSLFILKWGGK